ncbi:MAG: GDP-mannose 4,6-dehydratase [Candidatus Levyibacteriota bacterium]
MAKKALITGITGFAGSFLSELLLEHGYEVHGTSLSSTKSNSPTHIKTLDLLDKKATEQYVQEVSPDVIFHLAALTSPADSFSNPEQTITNNIAAEINVLEAVRLGNFSPRILVMSSAEVYGLVSSKDLPINEGTPLKPVSPYAVSKIAQDFLGLQYHLSYNMDIIRVRPFNHIGPRQAPGFVVPSFAKQIAEIEKKKTETVIKVGNLDAKRDFTDVRDMVKAYLLLSEKGKAGEVYNIGSGKSYRIGEILDSLLAMSTVKIETRVDPSRLRPSDTPDIYSDNTKIEEATDWKPQIPLAQTLQDTLNYWRESA